MPFINLKVIEGVFDGDQTREITERMTDTITSIRGEARREVTLCVVEEVQER